MGGCRKRGGLAFCDTRYDVRVRVEGRVRIPAGIARSEMGEEDGRRSAAMQLRCVVRCAVSRSGGSLFAAG